ncbi:unnamed protein product [Didymodactylos carnosus]|uniref:Protein kinase domain-containing protein n=1 Tax=Didymodactylos carnosus TaxID=1234261 RepID=A0A8S2CPH5_9BILA|nr:unnamed protein product [Didymodactylos carnosus]CAF3505830.1 unnamed protein product [Didymodactylos carnosus]
MPKDSFDQHCSNSDSPLILDNRFIIGPVIDRGVFGEIRLGRDSITSDNVAVKIELMSPAYRPRLETEYNCYKTLGDNEGIPRIFYFGQVSDMCTLVMDYLGSSLAKLFDSRGRRFTLKTIVMIGLQLLDRLETIHSKYILFRDIKPANFCIGRSSQQTENVIHIIDFGLAKEYINSVTGLHIPYKENKPLVGTTRFMSVNVHLGREYSRRDDLESLGYMIIYFLHGKLPWQNIKESMPKKRLEKLANMKRSLAIESLCEGAPNEFIKYFHHVRELEFYDTPDYNYLKQLFHTVLETKGFKNDRVFDWTTEKIIEFIPRRMDTSDELTTVMKMNDAEHDQFGNIVDGTQTKTFYRSCNVIVNELRYETLNNIKKNKRNRIVVVTDIDCCCFLSSSFSQYDGLNVTSLQLHLDKLVNDIYPKVGINVIDCRIIHIAMNYSSIRHWNLIKSSCIFNNNVSLLNEQQQMNVKITLNELNTALSYDNEFYPIYLTKFCRNKFINLEKIHHVLPISIQRLKIRFNVVVNNTADHTIELWITNDEINLISRSTNLKQILEQNLFDGGENFVKKLDCKYLSNECQMMNMVIGAIFVPSSSWYQSNKNNSELLKIYDLPHHFTEDRSFSLNKICSTYNRQAIFMKSNASLIIECSTDCTDKDDSILIYFECGTIRLVMPPLIVDKVILYSIDRPLTCPTNQNFTQTILHYLTESSKSNDYFHRQFSYINHYESISPATTTTEKGKERDSCLTCSRNIYPKINLTFYFFTVLIKKYQSNINAKTYFIVPDQYLPDRYVSKQQNYYINSSQLHLNLLRRHTVDYYMTYNKQKKYRKSGRIFFNDYLYIQQFVSIRTEFGQQLHIEYEAKNTLIQICLKQTCQKILYSDVCLKDGTVHIIDGILPVEDDLARHMKLDDDDFFMHNSFGLDTNDQDVHKKEKIAKAVDRIENEKYGEILKYVMALIPMVINSILVLLVNYCLRPDEEG